ncbi:MAG: sulfotransferase [Chloroflexota bacterium]|nr:sulfotransferase [Chloroflexota bacterium]
MLNRAPEVCLASETHYLAWARRVRLDRQLHDLQAHGSDDDGVRTLADQFFLPDSWPWLARNVAPDEFARRLATTDLSQASIFETLMQLYAERRCGPVADGAILGEKTPDHLHHVVRLAEWFPGALIIHTFRDPRAIYASQLRRVREARWGPKARLPWLPAALIDPLLAPIEAVHTTLNWRDAVRLHHRYRRLLGDRYRLIRFEDLVANPEREVRSLCEFIGIEYSPDMLEGVDVVGSSFEAARHSSTGFDRRTIERWRLAVHPLARRWFSLALGRQLDAFGYKR